MAKANMQLPDGVVVTIEGSPEEIAVLMRRISEPARSEVLPVRPLHGKKPKSKSPSSLRDGPQKLIEQVLEEGFFKAKRSIGDVQRKLEEAGHIYATNSLSTPLVRLIRNRVLRRIKDKDGWMYVAS